MPGLMKKVADGGRNAAGRAVKKLETKILVSQGRKAIRRKMRAAGMVSRKAAKTGLITGTIVAAGVVVREIRKRRREG
jgi:hypothetical protein